LPYDGAKLGFLLLAVWGAFVLPGQQSFTENNFTLKAEASLDFARLTSQLAI